MYTINLSQNKSHIPYISSTLLEKIEENIQKKEKTILYLNKRGEYNSLICESCNHLYKCPACDISLNVHKYPEKLICHSCDFRSQILTKCTQCDKNTLKKIGIGTQQIESAMKQEFPNANVFRFDTDSVKNKSQKQEVLDTINQADIIIGTKMITTGFNIPKLGLISVILLEQELQSPNYNIEEKLYSNIKQLLGRGNRNGQVTDIMIQTFIPENPIIQTLTHSNYKDFFVQTLMERKLFNYPPYCEMAVLEYRHREKQKAADFMKKLEEKLHNNNLEKKQTIRFVQTPFRRNNQYFYKIVIKGTGLHDFANGIKKDIFRHSGLSITFE